MKYHHHHHHLVESGGKRIERPAFEVTREAAT
jgi:hypothetical protein